MILAIILLIIGIISVIVIQCIVASRLAAIVEEIENMHKQLSITKGSVDFGVRKLSDDIKTLKEMVKPNEPVKIRTIW